MRKMFTFLMAACGLLGLRAAEAVFMDSLNTAERFAQWKVIDVNEDKCTWSFDEYDAAAAYSYSGINPGDDWLLSPGIAVEAGAYLLEFEYKGSSYGEKLDVFYGTTRTVDGMTHAVVDLGTITNDDSYAKSTSMLVVDEAGTIYLGFHAKSDADKYKLYVKNVSLSAAEGKDAATLSVTTVESGYEMGEEDITVRVANNGKDAIANLQVGYSISGGATVNETIASLEAGAELDYTFAQKADFTETGAYTIKAWTALEGDEIPGNDTCSITLRHKGPARVPYFNGFEPTDNTEDIVLIDLNEDPADDNNGDWSVNEDGFFSAFARTGSFSLVYFYSKNNPGNDWAILEPINLEPGYYSFRFWYSSFGEHPERLSAYYGTEATPEGMTHLLASYDPFQSDTYLESASVVHIETAGTYYFGFHATSDPDENVICVDDVSLERIENPVLDDVAVGTVTSPAFGYVRAQTSHDLVFAVSNNGLDTVHNIGLDVSLNGQAVEGLPATIDTLSAQATQAITAVNALAALEPGEYTLRIELTNEGDATPADNVLETTFKVVGDPVIMYDFENGGKVPAGFTLRVEDEGTVNAQLADIFPDNAAWGPVELEPSATYGSWLLASPSYLDGALQADRWCIFPQVSVISDDADMVFVAMSGDMGAAYYESYEVLVSETGTETADFTKVLEVQNEAFADAPSTRGISLGAYSGKSIYVAVRQITADGFMLNIDNVGFYGGVQQPGSGMVLLDASGRVFLNNNTLVCPEGTEQIDIYDMGGRLMVSNRTGSRLTDVSDLAPGVYVAAIRANGQIMQAKFVK